MTHEATLVGRESELQHLLAALAPGSACRVVLAAPPGTGKTALVEAFLTATAALEVTVLRVRPTEVDQRLAFSGLTDLLAPVEQSSYDDLPTPQRRAIRAALLLEDADGEVDPRAVAAALRAVWTALAGIRPVLVVLDDAQWLDQATATVLSHSLRRLGDAPVHVVAVGRAEEWPLVLDDATALMLPRSGPPRCSTSSRSTSVSPSTGPGSGRSSRLRAATRCTRSSWCAARSARVPRPRLTS